MTDLSTRPIADLFACLVKGREHIGILDAQERGYVIVALVAPWQIEVIDLLDALTDVVLVQSGIDPRCENPTEATELRATECVDELLDIANSTDGTMCMKEHMLLKDKAGNEVVAHSYMSVHPARHRDALCKFFNTKGHTLGLKFLRL